MSTATSPPMLFGYLLCLVAMGIMMNSVSIAFIIPASFIGFWTIWIKTREEPVLEACFGEAYTRYRQKTSYLVPRKRRV